MTNMSRVERRKAQNLYEDQNAALADDYVDDGESLPTRQSVKNQREQKKKQGKTKTPLFTVLAVIFVFVPVIVLVTLFYLKSHPDNHDDYEDVFIDSSQSKYEVVPKSEDKNDTADTKETALQKESKKEPEDSRPKEPAKTADDKKQTAVAEKEARQIRRKQPPRLLPLPNQQYNSKNSNSSRLSQFKMCRIALSSTPSKRKKRYTAFP